MNQPDRPVRQWTRNVTVLDVVPARADIPGVGEKTAILTVAHGDDIEALMFNLPDIEKLLMALVAIVGHHRGKPSWEATVAELFGDADDAPQPVSIDWERHQREITPEDLSNAIYGRTLRHHQPDPHAIPVPSDAIRHWLLGAVCATCQTPLTPAGVTFKEMVLLARKWTVRWEVQCPACERPYKLSVSTMPRRIRGV